MSNIPNLNLEPGLKLMLELEGLTEKLSSSLVGHVKGRFMLLVLPHSPHVPKHTVFEYLYPENTTTVRFLYEGVVMGFSADVIKYVLTPFPLLFLKYPRQFATHNLRKNQRITCLFHAKARLGGLCTDCVVTDMSMGGCMIFLDAPDNGDGNRSISVDIDDPIALECSFFGASGQSAIQCTAKRVEARYGKLGIGLKFNDMETPVTTHLTEYVNKAMHYLGD